jgi:hypothetical protein
MWFESLERNIIRPRRECCCIVVCCMKRVQVHLKESPILSIAWPLIAQDHDNYTVAQSPTSGPRAVGSLHNSAILTKSSKWCLNGWILVWSCHSAMSCPCTTWRRVVGSLSTVALLREWSTGQRCTVVALQPPAHTCCRYLMCLHVL